MSEEITWENNKCSNYGKTGLLCLGGNFGCQWP